MKVVIIKYNAGNIRSVDFALRRLGFSSEITGDHDAIRKADKVIFPGVGEASTTMNYLRENGLDRVIRALEQPVLGICLGLQLMCAGSEEGNTRCIGIFDEMVRKFKPLDKIPHMGWNTLKNVKGKLFSEDLNEKYAYFVHSYYAPVGRYTSAVTDYIIPFSSALERNNFFATQFHPEKSGSIGEYILKRFIEL